jgi:hypothetical protein
VNDLFGDLSNTGEVVVTGGAHVTFHGDVAQNGRLNVSSAGSTTSVAVFLGTLSGAGEITGGGDIFIEGTLSPGNSPGRLAFDSDLRLGSASELLIELGGRETGVAYDQVLVGGDVTLSGNLRVDLVNGFSPRPGDVFDIFVADGAVSRWRGKRYVCRPRRRRYDCTFSGS